MVEAGQPAESVVKLLTRASRAVLVHVDCELAGVVTRGRGNLLEFLTR